MTTKAITVLTTVVSATLLSTTDTREGQQFRVHLFQSRYVAGEPIVATVELRNTSARMRSIPLLTAGLEENILLRLSGDAARSPLPIPLHICDLRPELSNLNPGASFFAEFNLLDHFTNLDQPGKYALNARISPHGFRKNAVVFTGQLDAKPQTFQIVEPRGIDADAYQVIQVTEYPGRDGSPRNSFQWLYAGSPKLCEEIIADYAQSTYAKYARCYLGDYYQRRNFADEALKHYAAVVSDFPVFAMTPQAQWGIARCHFLKKEYATAWREAEKVVARFPRTYAAEKAVKLLAEIAEKRRADSAKRE